MKTGHYMVTRAIPLRAPFEAPCLGLGSRFDVLDTAPGYVLVKTGNDLRDANTRVWKPVKDFEDEHGNPKAICLTEKVVAEDGYHMIDPQPQLKRVLPGDVLSNSANDRFEAKRMLAFLTADTAAVPMNRNILQFPRTTSN